MHDTGDSYFMLDSAVPTGRSKWTDWEIWRGDSIVEDVAGREREMSKAREDKVDKGSRWKCESQQKPEKRREAQERCPKCLCFVNEILAICIIRTFWWLEAKLEIGASLCLWYRFFLLPFICLQNTLEAPSTTQLHAWLRKGWAQETSRLLFLTYLFVCSNWQVWILA